jgi:hypothetical protein
MNAILAMRVSSVFARVLHCPKNCTAHSLRTGSLGMLSATCSSCTRAPVADGQNQSLMDCIRASNPAPVQHKRSTLKLPVHLSGFPTVISVTIDLPVVARLPLASILKTVQYLTAHAWYSDNSHLLQAECQELLSALSSIAGDLTSMAQDEEAKTFLALLSQLGKPVSIDGGMQVELCGLGQEKAVVKIQGKICIRRLTEVLRPL